MHHRPVKTYDAPGYQAPEYQAPEYRRSENLDLFASAKKLATERQRRNPHPGCRLVELPGRGRRG